MLNREDDLAEAYQWYKLKINSMSEETEREVKKMEEPKLFDENKRKSALGRR